MNGILCIVLTSVLKKKKEFTEKSEMELESNPGL